MSGGKREKRQEESDHERPLSFPSRFNAVHARKDEAKSCGCNWETGDGFYELWSGGAGVS